MAATTNMDWTRIIQQDTDILGGTPVFAGTRVPVQTLIDYLIGGDSLNDFLEGFPSVSRQQATQLLEAALHAAINEGHDARAA